MIGFDTIGQSAIASQSADAADVVIYVPVAVAVTLTTSVPVVRGGVSVAMPAGAVTVTAPVAAVRAGSLVTVPVATITATAPTGAVRISATVTAPAPPDVPLTTAAPFVTAGASVATPVGAVAVTTAVPFVTAGKSVAVPVAAVTVTAPVAAVQISATITTPALTVAVAFDPPQIFGGNYIEASNTITMNTPFGEIGSSSIGEFAIGEGEPATRIVRRGPFVLVSTPIPLVTAGKSVFSPVAANINVTSARAEIDSRGRKLRVLAIAS